MAKCEAEGWPWSQDSRGGVLSNSGIMQRGSAKQFASRVALSRRLRACTKIDTLPLSNKYQNCLLKQQYNGKYMYIIVAVAAEGACSTCTAGRAKDSE
jgi:hypothetical protein